MTGVHPDVESVLLTKEAIDKRVGELAAEIKRDLGNENPLFVGVLRGSFIFLSDLMRASDMRCEVDFMSVSSYGAGTVTSGHVRIMKDIERDVEGRNLVIVEDILDSGETLKCIMELIQTRKPKSMRLCVLLDKPERRRVPVTPQYTGFTIPDAFVVGYGLDYAERYRNLPYIGILKPSVYQ